MDQKDCVLLIQELPDKDRKRGSKLYEFIVQNIVNHPNEKKWSYLYYDKIYQKFNKQQIWIELLLHSGFKKLNKSPPILKFNADNIESLKQSLCLLQKAQISDDSKDIEQEVESKEMEQVEMDTMHLYCICGKQLIQNTVDTFYGKDAKIICDECFVQCKGTDIIYHCVEKTKSPLHRYGYELCTDCVMISNNRYKEVVCICSK